MIFLYKVKEIIYIINWNFDWENNFWLLILFYRQLYRVIDAIEKGRIGL